MPHLLVKSGPDAGRRFSLAESVISVGRHSSNAISLADDRVSRQHLEIRNTPAGFRVSDLESGNGTLVNGRSITDHDLADGDEITIGDTVFIFHDEATRFRSSIVRTVPESAGPQILANLGVLYEAATVVSQILDVDELLGRILDLVMTATHADHAAALLNDTGTGELMPQVVRSSTEADFAFSRTIVDYVTRERQGVLATDAATDARFAGGESIARHSLREVICVPMRGRHDTVGVIFLDKLSSQAKFTGDHLNLAVALAHQAALAIEETRYHRKLLNAERLAAVGQTIAGMSHHIKNIMQGVRFGGDMIRTGISGDDRELIAKGWKLVEKNQGRIDALIMDMLSYSKEREPDKEPADLAKVIDDVLELLRPRMTERGVGLSTEVASAIIDCDADSIHAAILNLVGNALDALEGQESARLRIALEREPDAVLIVVDDNGPGIPAEQREAIFEPFISSKGSRGTGLGLPVSRKILREHGGDLVAHDSPLGGARFVLRLPTTIA